MAVQWSRLPKHLAWVKDGLIGWLLEVVARFLLALKCSQYHLHSFFSYCRSSMWLSPLLQLISASRPSLEGKSNNSITIWHSLAHAGFQSLDTSSSSTEPIFWSQYRSRAGEELGKWGWATWLLCRWQSGHWSWNHRICTDTACTWRRLEKNKFDIDWWHVSSQYSIFNIQRPDLIKLLVPLLPKFKASFFSLAML